MHPVKTRTKKPGKIITASSTTLQSNLKPVQTHKSQTIYNISSMTVQESTRHLHTDTEDQWYESLKMNQSNETTCNINFILTGLPALWLVLESNIE